MFQKVIQQGGSENNVDTNDVGRIRSLRNPISLSGMLRCRTNSTDRLDVLSLDSGCSIEDTDASHFSSSRRKTTTSQLSQDDDNLVLYRLEGGLYGVAVDNEKEYTEYLKLVDVQARSSSPSSSELASPYTPKEMMDVDEYLWSN
jgi:hypothetical protein